ncbi:hypothetical protein D3C81_1968680 [compost metagenome]
MRQAYHTFHHVQTAEHFDLDHANPRTDPHPLPVIKPATGQIVRMHQQLMTRLALHEAMIVVHPRIVAAHVASTDHQQLIGSRCLQGGEACQVGKDRGRSGLDSLIGGFQA